MKKFKYEKFTETLEDEIYDRYAPGQRFPSEEELCRRFKCNRATIRKSLEALSGKGLLNRKGRGGSFVTDFINSGFDNHLLTIVMPIRGHLWDKLYIDFSCLCTEHDRFVLAVDSTAAAESVDGAEEKMFFRLKRALRFRPRNVIIASDHDINTFLNKLGSARRKFRNLVWLKDSDVSICEDPHLGQVCLDMNGTWKMLTENAIHCNYRHICVFVPEISKRWQPLEDGAKKVLSEYNMNIEVSCFTEERLQESLNGLVNLAREKESMAIICTYDYGAHLAAGALRTAGIAVPERVGIYGVNNTPWAEKDDLTTVGYDTALWSRKISECINKLDRNLRQCEITVPPNLIQRSSTRAWVPSQKTMH